MRYEIVSVVSVTGNGKRKTGSENMSLILFDKKYLEKYEFIAGIDEAGRGAWAGPVVAAAAIMPYNIIIDDINDSKKLTPKQVVAIKELFNTDLSNRKIAKIFNVTHETIRKINIGAIWTHI